MCLIAPVVTLGISVIAMYNLQAIVTYRLKEAKQDVRYETSVVANRIAGQMQFAEKSVNALANIVQDFEGTHKDLQLSLSHFVETHPEITGSALLATQKWRKLYHLKPCADKEKSHLFPYACYLADYVYEVDKKIHYLNLNTLEPNDTEHVWYRLMKMPDHARWLGSYPSSLQKKYLFSYAAPIHKKYDGKSIAMAYVIGDMDLNKVFESAQLLMSKQLVSARLIDAKGNVLMDGKGNKMYALLDTFLDGQPSAEWLRVLKEISQGKKGIARLPCQQNGYSECLYTYQKLPATEVSLVLSFALDEAIASIHHFVLYFLLLSLLLMGVTLWVIHRICRNVTDSLVSLSDAAEYLSKGEFNQPIAAAKGNDEVGTLVNAFVHMQSELQHYMHRLKTETAKTNRFEGEMHAASIIQQSMLNGKGASYFAFDPFALWAMLKSAHAVGGDFYHYAFGAPGQLMFVIGDVSDKGVSAALFMAKALSIFKYEIQAKKGLPDILQSMNDELFSQNEACMFVTLISGELDISTGRVRFVSAGHDMPFVIRDKGVVQLEGERTQALGLQEAIQFPVNVLDLAAGERLVCFTDGLTEAFNEKGEIFGICRLARVLKEKSTADIAVIGDSAFKAVHQFSGAIPRSDDMALLVIGREPSYSFLINPDSAAHISHYQYAADLGVVGVCLNDIDEYGKNYDIETRKGDIQLVLEELLSNAVKYGQIPDGKKINCHWCLANGTFYVEVVYQGCVFNPFVDSYPDSNSPTPCVGGLGLTFVKLLTDEQVYCRDNKNNRLCFIFTCS